MNSSKQTGKTEAQRFLTELANLQMGWSGFERFFARFGKTYFPADFLTNSDFVRTVRDDGGETDPARLRKAALMQLYTFATGLRRAWEEQIPSRREWRIFKMREKMHRRFNPEWNGDEPPEETPIDRALLYFQRSGELAKRCGNPDCPAAPYFFAARKGQKYCSEECAQPAQRASKRNWWATTGAKKRATKKRRKK
jgi:hypothetical protein